MEITEIKVFPVREEKLKAFVSIVFDGCFMVNDIKIIHGRDGRFISMPSRRKKNGEFKDVAHPLNNETRGRITEQILTEYDRIIEARQDREPPKRATARGAKEEEAGDRDAASRDHRGTRGPDGSGDDEGASALERLEEDLLREDEWTPPGSTASGGVG